MSLSTLGRPNGTMRLTLFDEFETDFDLPKHRKLRAARQARQTQTPRYTRKPVTSKVMPKQTNQ